ncbi:MAG: phosphate/phosphite/phosphonate ABC transporter substrate-binding protein [Rhodocyclaceae bacterium]|nr:phosphate/phosphite/phosphonate ABC transporter substrate-binding protein [Rhodocyclaceae bacterium]MDZ4216508.1 phosphate/phosphite/phosphonate ABC transporter substrate-binding protein [Rhodocyclaceae bacterium]
MTHTTFLRLVATLLLGFLGLFTKTAFALTFAVVPQFSPEQIAQAWSPILSALSQATGVKLELKIYPSIGEFEAAFIKGEPDIAYMNPYHAVMARKAAGYVPVIRDDLQRLTGILVVRKNSPVTQISQLDGGTLAFPAPNAFGASLYMRALLTEEAMLRFTPVYVKTHSNVFRHVITGSAIAGGAIRQTLAKERPEVQAELRIIYETPPAFAHPVAVHPRVPAGVRMSLQQAFLKLGGDPAYAEALNAIQIPGPAKTNYAEYAPLEKLGLERYIVLKEE